MGSFHCHTHTHTENLLELITSDYFFVCPFFPLQLNHWNRCSSSASYYIPDLHRNPFWWVSHFLYPPTFRKCRNQLDLSTWVPSRQMQELTETSGAASNKALAEERRSSMCGGLWPGWEWALGKHIRIYVIASIPVQKSSEYYGCLLIQCRSIESKHKLDANQ